MAFGTLIFLVTPSAIYSCGPFLESAIFSFEDRPDEPAENFAASKLGIIRPGFRQAYLAGVYCESSSRSPSSAAKSFPAQ